jgi:hypothetical protein
VQQTWSCSCLSRPPMPIASLPYWRALKRLRRGADPAADDAPLAPFGDVDPIDWSIEAVRALMVERA